MRKLWLAAVFFAAASALFGQLDDNTFTVTASRAIDLQPDQVIIGVYVDSPFGTGLDDVLGALQSSGVTAANLSGIYSLLNGVYISPYLSSSQRTQWTFALPVAFSKLKDTLAALKELQQTVSGPGNTGSGKAGLDLSFGIQGTQVSPELQASRPCPWPSLAGDARAHVQKLAAAAGLSVGPIVAISDGNASGISPGALLTSFAFPGNIIPAERVGIFTGFATFGAYGTPPPNCSMTVQFKLVH